MTDREERQHVIEVLKQMRLDYEDFWEENDTEEIKAFNYAIASIETDLKYDLLYEETIGQADKQADKSTTKKYLSEEDILELKHRYGDEVEFVVRDMLTSEGKRWDKLPSIKSTTKNDLVVDWENYKDVDGNSLDDLILEVLQNNFDCGNTYGYKVADEIIELLPSVTPQEPKTGHWIEYTRVLIPEPINRWEQAWYCSECGYGNQECEDGSAWLEWKYCPNCGADMRGEEE